MQTTKYKNKVAVVATLSHLSDGKSWIRYSSVQIIHTYANRMRGRLDDVTVMLF